MRGPIERGQLAVVLGPVVYVVSIGETVCYGLVMFGEKVVGDVRRCMVCSLLSGIVVYASPINTEYRVYESVVRGRDEVYSMLLAKGL